MLFWIDKLRGKSYLNSFGIMKERATNEERKKLFKRIIKEIRRDPEKGLRCFYDTYGKIIQITAQTICSSSDKANEVVNDVLVKIWKTAEIIVDIDNPEGWIYVITANTAKDSLRQRKLFPLNEDIAVDDSEVQEVIDRDSFNWIINDLSETEQMIMINKFASESTFQEIADELNKPLTTVTSIYYRALENVKKKLQDGSK